MIYEPRVPVDEAYVQLLGRAFYNFTYLERIILTIIEHFDLERTREYPRRKITSGQMADELRIVLAADSSIGEDARTVFDGIHSEFRNLAVTRNDLLHAYPYTVPGGEQRLAKTKVDGRIEWPEESVTAAAIDFENCAIRASDAFFKYLQKSA